MTDLSSKMGQKSNAWGRPILLKCLPVIKGNRTGARSLRGANKINDSEVLLADKCL